VSGSTSSLVDGRLSRFIEGLVLQKEKFVRRISWILGLPLVLSVMESLHKSATRAIFE
jgi:hypothetical protein